MVTAITWNEMHGPDGAVRPHWQVLDRALQRIGPGEMWRRWEQARQLIRQHGVTLQRLWRRARAGPAVAARSGAGRSGARRVRDARGGPGAAGDAARSAARRSVRAAAGDRRRAAAARGDPGAPGAAARRAPGSCRRAVASCTSTPPIWCARPKGELRVLADRTQAPAGAGYALENRIVLGRVLPEAFRDCHAQRLASFFRTLRDTLPALAPHGRENPRIVLLTAGAAQRDLLRAGVPGAVPRLSAGRGRRPDRARRARVPEDAGRTAPGRRHPAPAARRLVRSAGAAARVAAGRAGAGAGGARRAASRSRTRSARAWCETPALTPFLPSLCRALLGEDLQLGSVETWWCGQPTSLRTCSSRLGEMVIKPAYPAARGPVRGGPPVRPSRSISARARRDASRSWRRRCARRPGATWRNGA